MSPGPEFQLLLRLIRPSPLIAAKRAADVAHYKAIDAQDEAERGVDPDVAEDAFQRGCVACGVVNEADWRLATTPPTTLAGVAAVLRFANQIEDAGMEWSAPTRSVTTAGITSTGNYGPGDRDDHSPDGGLSHVRQCRHILPLRLPPHQFQKAAAVKERHSGGASGEGRGVGNTASRCCLHVARSSTSAFGRSIAGRFAEVRCVTDPFGATVVGKMHTAGLRGEPLAATPIHSVIGTN